MYLAETEVIRQWQRKVTVPLTEEENAFFLRSEIGMFFLRVVK